jgi:hypothetical protein
MLEEQINGANDSWAVRWHASAFLAEKLTLYPGRSLVNNIGNDASGTHCGKSNAHDVVLSSTPIDLSFIEVLPSVVGSKAFEKFFRYYQGGLVKRIQRFFISILRKLVA